MAERADAMDLKSVSPRGVGVRIPPDLPVSTGRTGIELGAPRRFLRVYSFALEFGVMARDTRVSGKYDWVSFALVFGIWPLYLIWETFLLLKRKYWDARDGSKPQLISGEAKTRGWQLNSIVYVWSGMAAHWWWNAPGWGTALTGVLFWALSVTLLVFDIFVWKRWGAPSLAWPRWLRWVRFPAWWMTAGILGGRFLFPQSGLLPWSWTP